MYGPSFDSSGTGGTARVIQENDYYPFGLTVKYLDYSNGNRYLYNRKEQQLDLTNQYDYGARFYDPVIGRWTTVDPDAENYESTSSYAYVLNNPINLGDLDGRDTIHLKEVFIKEPVPVPAPAPTPVYEPLTILEQIGTVGGAVLRGGLLTFALVSIPLNGEDIHEDAEMKKYWRHVHASKKSVKEVLKDAKHLDS
jgi:RHS repeat-associated protein